MCQTWIATIEGWPVLNWLVHVSSSSCKGTFGLLHFMGSNTMIFLAVTPWPKPPVVRKPHDSVFYTCIRLKLLPIKVFHCVNREYSHIYSEKWSKILNFSFVPPNWLTWYRNTFFWPIIDCFSMYVTGVTRSDALKVLFHANRRRIGGSGHFRSRDKDGGQTIWSAVAENPMLYANFTTLSFIEPELLPIEVLHCGNREFNVFFGKK